MEMNHEAHKHGTSSDNKMYKKLAVMILLSFAAMYILMYAMVDKLSNVIPNVNQLYMAALMTMPMLILELAIMGSMYMKKKLNVLLIATGVAGLFIFFFCIHKQAFVNDKQFLKSMIPHHAAAVLMVEEANIKDPEIKDLANNIITSQQKEIEQMKAKIKELEK
jgi:uncharacterized protein (DUF305 family)